MPSNHEHKDAVEQSPPTVTTRRPRSNIQYIPGQSSKDLARRAALLQENPTALTKENLHRLSTIGELEEPRHKYNDRRVEDWVNKYSELFYKTPCDESNEIWNAKEEPNPQEISEESRLSMLWLENPELTTDSGTNTASSFEDNIPGKIDAGLFLKIAREAKENILARDLTKEIMEIENSRNKQTKSEKRTRSENDEEANIEAAEMGSLECEQLEIEPEMEVDKIRANMEIASPENEIFDDRPRILIFVDGPLGWRPYLWNKLTVFWNVIMYIPQQIIRSLRQWLEIRQRHPHVLWLDMLTLYLVWLWFVIMLGDHEDQWIFGDSGYVVVSCGGRLEYPGLLFLEGINRRCMIEVRIPRD